MNTNREDKKIEFLVDYNIKFNYEIPEKFDEKLLSAVDYEVTLTKTFFNKSFLKRDLWSSVDKDSHLPTNQYQIKKLRNKLTEKCDWDFSSVVEKHMHSNFNLSQREVENLDEDYAFTLDITKIFDKTRNHLIYQKELVVSVDNNIENTGYMFKYKHDGLERFV